MGGGDGWTWACRGPHRKGNRGPNLIRFPITPLPAFRRLHSFSHQEVVQRNNTIPTRASPAVRFSLSNQTCVQIILCPAMTPLPPLAFV